MDPNEALKEIRELVTDLMKGERESTLSPEKTAQRLDDGDRLAELIDGLDEWLSKGGYLPGPWKPKVRL